MNLNASAFRHLIYYRGYLDLLMIMSQETRKIYTERMRRKVYKNEASIQVTFVRFRKMLSIEEKEKFLLTNLRITQKLQVHVD